ncbi:hypothetical protein GCM10022254_75420 [Actinomadura meridiana]|uniref:Uncharacterized protein n=1 Tax=Actinomadura meridiana TaxID=559626 RepID=A0ABP8CRE2_9ACTN
MAVQDEDGSDDGGWTSIAFPQGYRRSQDFTPRDAIAFLGAGLDDGQWDAFCRTVNPSAQNACHRNPFTGHDTTDSGLKPALIGGGIAAVAIGRAVLCISDDCESGAFESAGSRTRWGIQFRNRDGDLHGVSGKSSPYLEYRVAPPSGVRGAGPLRVVVDPQTGATYYAWAHYGDSGNPAFVRIR